MEDIFVISQISENFPIIFQKFDFSAVFKNFLNFFFDFGQLDTAFIVCIKEWEYNTPKYVFSTAGIDMPQGIGLKDVPCPLINVSYMKNLTTGYFYSEFWGLKISYRTRKWLSKGITGREFGSQNCLPDGNLALKIAYRTGIWLSKALPDGNWALKITYRTRIWP